MILKKCAFISTLIDRNWRFLKMAISKCLSVFHKGYEKNKIAPCAGALVPFSEERICRFDLFIKRRRDGNIYICSVEKLTELHR